MSDFQITFEEADKNLLACATYLAERIRNFDGHAEAMAEIVPRFLAKTEVDVAAELANAVADPFTRDRLLDLTAEKCAAIGDDEYAFQLVEAIEDSGKQAQAREHIALQKSLKGDYAGALEIARTLDHADHIFADAAVRQAASGDDENSNNTLDEIDFPAVKIHALQSIAALDLKAGDEEKAARRLDDAAQSSGEIEFPEEKVRAMIELGDYFIEAKRKDRAVEIFDQAKTVAETVDGVQRDSLLANVALGFLKAGSLELADRALDLVEDKTQTAFALHGFAQSFWAQGETEEAAEALDEAYQILKSQRDQEVRNSRERYGIWRSIAAEFARFGKAERAIEIAQEIPDETLQTNALSLIAQICTTQERAALARQSLNSIADEAQKVFALTAMSDAESNAEKTEEALTLLREAESLIETVPQFAYRASAFNEIAKRFFNLGEKENARRLLEENLETVRQIRDESSRAVALAQLGDFYEQLGFELNGGEREILQTLIRQAGA